MPAVVCEPVSGAERWILSSDGEFLEKIRIRSPSRYRILTHDNWWHMFIYRNAADEIVPGTGAPHHRKPPHATSRPRPGHPQTHHPTMSAIEPSNQSQHTHLEELPQFDLEYLFDDDDCPTEVTIFADDPESLSTRWITIDREFAVPLEEVR